MGCKQTKPATETHKVAVEGARSDPAPGQTPPFVMGYDEDVLKEFEEEFKKEQEKGAEREKLEEAKAAEREEDKKIELQKQEENYQQFEKEAEEERKALQAELADGRIQEDYLKL